jgi:hypothetical protein
MVTRTPRNVTFIHAVLVLFRLPCWRTMSHIPLLCCVLAAPQLPRLVDEPSAGIAMEAVKTFVFYDVCHVLRCIVGWTMKRVLTSSHRSYFDPLPRSFCPSFSSELRWRPWQKGEEWQQCLPLSWLYRMVPTTARVPGSGVIIKTWIMWKCTETCVSG